MPIWKKDTETAQSLIEDIEEFVGTIHPFIKYDVKNCDLQPGSELFIERNSGKRLRVVVFEEQ